MTRDKPESKPRRTPLVLWLMLAIVGLALLLLGVSLFGPNPPIQIGKDTTRITTPLADDGLPDYAAALLARGRIGRDGKPITPERNGAIPFLRAMWGESEDDFDPLTEDEAQRLLQAIGAAEPSAEDQVEPRYSHENRIAVVRLLRSRVAPPADGEKSDVEPHDFDGEVFAITMNDAAFFEVPEEEAAKAMRVEELIDVAAGRPWSAKELSFLAAWCERNGMAIDRLVAAGDRPEWCCPSANLLPNRRGSLLEIDLWKMGMLRSAARVLATRAMLRLGEGRTPEAIRDAVAILRLADHSRRGPWLVDQLVATGTEEMGLSVARRIAATECESSDTMAPLVSILDGTDSRAALLDCLDNGERYFGLETLLLAAGGKSLTDLDVGLDDLSGPVSTLSVDWNPVMKAHNRVVDDLLAAATLPTWSARKARFDAIETAIATPRSPRHLLLSGFSATARGNVVADSWAVAQSLSPMGISVFAADDRTTTYRQLTRVAIALALHRYERGDYPESLDEIVPAFLPTPPVDLFHNNPLGYRKIDDGYLLYSLGQNGRDDGGSSESMQFGAAKLEGVSVEELDDDRDGSSWDEEADEYVGVERPEDSDHPFDKIPAGADDISLRMPPVVEPWPWEVE